jgi:hypothetical protein
MDRMGRIEDKEFSDLIVQISNLKAEILNPVNPVHPF